MFFSGFLCFVRLFTFFQESNSGLYLTQKMFVLEY